MLICFGTEQYKIAEHFSKNTTQWTTSAIGRIFAEPNIPDLPINTQLKMNLKFMEVSLFYLVFKLGIILNNKTILFNTAFVSSKELWRSWRMLSASAAPRSP